MLHQGDVLEGLYQVLEEIGSGGSGVIYKGYHLRLQRYVVIKRIRDEVVDKINVRTEADILKRLKHTYLPQVYDFLVTDDGIYTVIDYIEGWSLDKYIDAGYQIEQKQIIRWTQQLCEALVYLHGQTPPIIHSDIKPQNIMITPQGNVCLIDFNISLDGQSSSQISGLSAGYAPPEQYFNLAPEIDPQSGRTTYRYHMKYPLDARSDIYSLGATLYHLMTLNRPQISTGPVTPITQWQLPYSQALIEVVGKMMEPDPNRRYQTAAELLKVFQDLRRLDKAYIRHRRACNVTTVVFAFLLTASVLLSFLGFRQMGVEKEEQYDGLVAEGTALEENLDYEGAIRRFDEAIDLFSTKLPAYYHKLLTYVRQGDYDACVQYGRLILTNQGLTDAMEEDPQGAADIYFMIGNGWFEKENYENAVQYYEQAVEYSEENPEYFRDYAIALARMQRTSEAEELLDRAVELGLETDSVTLVRAELLLAQGSWQQAAEEFQKAANSTSDETLRQRAYILCARAYRQGGEVDEEIRVLESGRNAVEATKTGPILSALGNAYMRRAQSQGGNLQADGESALECYELAMEKGNRSVELRLNVAAAYQLLDEYSQAKEVLEELIEEVPEDYRPYMRMALLCAAQENELPENSRDYRETATYYEKATAYYQQAKTDGVSDPEMQVLESTMQQIIDGGWLS